jgi:hypothetical protein
LATALKSMKETKAPIIRLARITHGDAGKCAACDAPAVAWYRTGVIADGRITVAARYCESHDPDTHPGAAQRLSELTIADVARLSPRRARRALERVARAETDAAAYGRTSAALQGASSLTHTYRLLAGVAAEEVETLRALATAASH